MELSNFCNCRINGQNFVKYNSRGVGAVCDDNYRHLHKISGTLQVLLPVPVKDNTVKYRIFRKKFFAQNSGKITKINVLRSHIRRSRSRPPTLVEVLRVKKGIFMAPIHRFKAQIQCIYAPVTANYSVFLDAFACVWFCFSKSFLLV